MGSPSSMKLPSYSSSSKDLSDSVTAISSPKDSLVNFVKDMNLQFRYS